MTGAADEVGDDLEGVPRGPRWVPSPPEESSRRDERAPSRPLLFRHAPKQYAVTPLAWDGLSWCAVPRVPSKQEGSGHARSIPTRPMTLAPSRVIYRMA
jgi:hypothetical protein